MNDLSVFYFPTAVALGALHALEPGHAKVLTASYLIGIKGTKKDSLVLGLSVALTHSLVVILISGLGLWLGNEAFAGEATHWLERGSGLVAISIGCWMLWRRLNRRLKEQPHHHHAPNPVRIQGQLLKGLLEIVDTPLGERMRFASEAVEVSGQIFVEIERGNGQVEVLHLLSSPDDSKMFLSAVAPAEPHEFSARLLLKANGVNQEAQSFKVHEPDHDHQHLDDVAHAKAHAEDLPEYVKTGERPTIGQIITFGMAGGMIPCPASITVMLLALSAGKTGIGLFTVMGFSLGLAIALVGVGMVVVSGLSRIETSGKFSWVSKQAPVISAGLVIVSGLFALFIAH